MKRYFDFPLFTLSVLSEMFRLFATLRINYMVLIRQIFFTGFEALSIVALSAFAIGSLIIIQGTSILPSFSQNRMFYTIFATIVIKELGIILTAIIVIARSGTAIATEIGNMIVNQEIEALLSFGISPINYLVVPRVIGVVVSMVLLAIYFSVSALLGGWLVSSYFTQVSIVQFFNDILSELSLLDIVSIGTKTLIIGFLIGAIACHQGLQVSGASTEVPQRTIKAVVLSLGYIILTDIIISIIFYLLSL